MRGGLLCCAWQLAVCCASSAADAAQDVVGWAGLCWARVQCDLVEWGGRENQVVAMVTTPKDKKSSTVLYTESSPERRGVGLICTLTKTRGSSREHLQLTWTRR